MDRTPSQEALTIPIMGCIVPNMGTIRTPTKFSPGPTPGVADALFTKVQQRVLGVLFGNPGRSFYANEIIALAGSGTGAVQRELSATRGRGIVDRDASGQPEAFSGQCFHARV